MWDGKSQKKKKRKFNVFGEQQKLEKIVFSCFSLEQFYDFFRLNCTLNTLMMPANALFFVILGLFVFLENFHSSLSTRSTA